MNNKREVIAFNQLVNAGETIQLSASALANGTIEQVVMRFYVGQELGLKVRAYIKNKALNDMQPIIRFAGNKKGLSGDDDTFTFNVSTAIQQHDEIVVELENVSSEFNYNAVVYVTVDYRAGLQSVIGSVI